MYYARGGSFERIESVTPKIKSSRGIKRLNPWGPFNTSYSFNGGEAQLQITETKPVFYLRIPDLSPRDVKLIILDRKDKSRDVEYSSVGVLGGTRTGPKEDKILGVEATRVAGDVLRVTPAKDLPPGEYAFDLGTAPTHDFGIAGKKK